MQKIWEARRLAPHRRRAFKLSTDPAALTEKLQAIVGLQQAVAKALALGWRF